MKSGTVCVAFLINALSTLADGAQVVEMRIDAQPMERALVEFAQQSGLQVLFPSDLACQECTSPKVVGAYPPDMVLDRLLEGSGMRFDYVNDRTVAIRNSDDSRRRLVSPMRVVEDKG